MTHNPAYPPTNPAGIPTGLLAHNQDIHTQIYPQISAPPPPIYQPQGLMIEPVVPDRQGYANTVPIQPQNKIIATETKGQQPQRFLCQNCQQERVSRVNHEMGRGSWLWCVFCAFTLPIFAPWPCCVKECQDTIHTCSQCNREVGRKKFLC